ncbi:MAG TPA: TIGR00725 family protein [Actinomycetota bacterium]|nr:TIGR00725 family protein [Actinomycetota bacterium]
MERLQTYIGVIGPSDASPEVLRDAEEAGLCIARAGAVLVTGGGGGAMQAACRGAKVGGGTTIGLLPGLSRGEGNPYLDISIPTGMGEMRNVLVVRCSDALLAVGGGFGTLSEIGLALKLDKPLAGIGTWQASLGDVTAPIPAAGSPALALRILLQTLGDA